jgi:hypothetical protein
MRRTAWVTVAAIAAAVAGMTPIASAPRAVAATASRARTTLISAGKSPRSPLRLAFTEGSVTDATMVMTESIDQSLDGKSMNSIHSPPISIGMRMTVESVSPESGARVSSAYHDIAVVDDGSYTAAQRAQLQTSLAPMASVTVSALVTTRNDYLDTKVSGTEGLSASTGQLMEQLSDQTGNLAVPFPIEAVGIGARWRSSSTVQLSGINLRQTLEYTLLERDGDHVTVSLKSTQTAPRQRAELPGLPAGTKVVITKYRVSGSGRMTLDLSEPVAVAGTSQAGGSQVFAVSAQGQSGTFTQKLEIEMTISRPS